MAALPKDTTARHTSSFWTAATVAPSVPTQFSGVRSWRWLRPTTTLPRPTTTTTTGSTTTYPSTTTTSIRPTTTTHLSPTTTYLVTTTSTSPGRTTTTRPATGINLQSLVDATPAGSTLTLPAGTIQVPSTVFLHSGITITGTAGQTVLTMPATARTGATFIFEGSNLQNVTLEGLTFRAASITDNVAGLYLVGAKNCRLSSLRFENLWYGMKLGSGNIGSGWVVTDIVARNCTIPAYISHIDDSAFARLDLQGTGSAGNPGHCIYMAEACHRLTFTDVTLTAPSRYGLHLYSGAGGTTSDITFNNLTVDCTSGRQPMCISDGFSSIRINNLVSRMSAQEVHLRLGGCTGVAIDGIDASGGYAFIGTWSGGRAGTVSLRNGTYTGQAVLSPVSDERGISNLIVDSVVTAAK